MEDGGCSEQGQYLGKLGTEREVQRKGGGHGHHQGESERDRDGDQEPDCSDGCSERGDWRSQRDHDEDPS